METIISPSNKTVKHIKSLYQKKNRDSYREIIIEGLKNINEAISSEWKIETIVFSETVYRSEDFDFLKNSCVLKKIKTIIVSEKLFNDICDTENSQGILAVLKIPDKSSFGAVTADDGFDLGNHRKIVILDSLQDPGNMGTVIRTADAFGADMVIVSEGCVDVYNPKTLRAAMGSIFHVPVYKSYDIEKLIGELKGLGIKILAAHLNGENFEDKDFIGNVGDTSSIAVIIGNEANGIRDSIAAAADRLIKIPMPGKAESLNASVAAGILMYEIFLSKT